MNENDDQMQKLEAGLRDHIIAWQAANPDKALDTSALQRTGTEYMASQVLGGDWDFGLDDVQDAPDVQGAASTPPAAAQAGDAKDGADTGQPGDDVVTSNTPGWGDGGHFVQVGQPAGASNPPSTKALMNPALHGVHGVFPGMVVPFASSGRASGRGETRT